MFLLIMDTFDGNIFCLSQMTTTGLKVVPSLARSAQGLCELPIVLLFAYRAFLHAFCRLLILSKINLKNYFRKTVRVSTSLGPDQARRFVGPGLDPNGLQRLSEDDTTRHLLQVCSTYR